MEMYHLKHQSKGFVKQNGTFGSDDRLYKTPKKVSWAAKIHYANTFKYATCRVRFRDLIDTDLVDANSNVISQQKPSVEILRQIAFTYGYFSPNQITAYDVYNYAKNVLGVVVDEYLYSREPLHINADPGDYYSQNGYRFFKNDEDVLMTSLSNPSVELFKISTIIYTVDNYILRELEGV